MLMKYKIRLIVLLSVVVMLTALDGLAQVSVGGTPLSWNSDHYTSTVPITLPVVDEAALLLEDEARLAIGEKSTRFGYNHEVAIDVLSSCIWETTSTHEIGLSLIHI